MPYLKKTHKVH